MNEIARIDAGNAEHIVYWDKEENKPRIQMDFDFASMSADKIIPDTLVDIFGQEKRIGDLMVGRRTGLPYEYALVRTLTWKELAKLNRHFTFRIYKVYK